MAKRRDTTYGLCRNLDGLVLPVTSERDWEQIQRGAAGAGRFLIVLVEDAMDRPHYMPIFVDEDEIQAELASVMATKRDYDEVKEVWDTWGAEEYVAPPPPERGSPWPWRRRRS